jgi:ABC-type branched-subunit amino acid transport system ATPase component
MTHCKMRISGITILIVEHNMQILDICDNVTVVQLVKRY